LAWLNPVGENTQLLVSPNRLSSEGPSTALAAQVPYSGLFSRGVYFAERAQLANFETVNMKVGVV
jgi:hypothetical protein